jgi:hypothetical protein
MRIFSEHESDPELERPTLFSAAELMLTGGHWDELAHL